MTTTNFIKESGTNSRNAYIILSSPCGSRENLRDPEYNKHYLTAKPLLKTNEKLSASVPNLNKCTERSLNKEESNNERSLISSVGTAKSSPKPSGNEQHNNNVQKPRIQVGMDRYITVLKRGRSPKSSKIGSSAKVPREDEANRNNRFAILADSAEETNLPTRNSKPPPIYLREKNSNTLIRKLISIIGENSFFVSAIRRGNIDETKIQVNGEKEYRTVVSEFEKTNKSFYTYQLKSAKGLQVVLKGIDAGVDPEDVKSGLIKLGFKVKHVINIKNRERIPQPMFRVELEPADLNLKKSETHPIYNIKFLLHRKITIEEPHKRAGPVQCFNCQEYGHTKSYCKLPTVCVVCGELHATDKCDKSKDDKGAKKCSNCGENHTANFRGCRVYSDLKKSVTRNTVTAHIKTGSINNSTVNFPPMAPTLVSNRHQHISQPVVGQVSYADAVKSSSVHTPKALPKNLPSSEAPSQNSSRLEASIDMLVQTMNNFMSNITNMMHEMMRIQSTLLQAMIGNR